MQRSLFIVLFMIVAYAHRAYASAWNSTNIDIKTEEAITATYTSHNLREQQTYSDLKEIFKHYTKASVATAGIFGVKALDRKALLNTRGFGSAEENYYYKRIYQLVAAEITPRILTVAVMCVKQPEKALYWGPYLFKVTEEVRQLCEQFSNIVTNNKLTFSDVAFFTLSDKVRDLFDLAQFGGSIDWKSLLNDMGNITSDFRFTKEDFMEEISNLSKMGSSIAGAGYDAFGDAFDQMGGASKELLSGKLKRMKEGYTQFREMYKTFSSPTNVKNMILSRIGGTDSAAVMNILNLHRGVEVGKYTYGYFTDKSLRYYRRTCYIQTEDKGTEEVCHYEPKEYTLAHDRIENWRDHPNPYQYYTQNGEWYFAEWPGNREPSDFREKSRQNTERFTGWSQSKIDKLNNEQTGDNRYIYSISFPKYYVGQNYEDVDEGWTKWPYGGHGAFSVHVSRYHDWKIIYYQETYDSYKTDLSTFQARMQQKLNEANYNQTYTKKENGEDIEVDNNKYHYKMVWGERVYYEETDAKKMEGCSTVSYVSDCSDETKMGDGDFSWKENGDHDHSDINDDSRRYAMETTLPDSKDRTEIEKKIEEIQQQKNAQQSELDALRKEQNELYRKINSSSYNEQKALQEQYDANTKKIENLKSEIAVTDQQLNSAKNARQAMIDDEADEKDGRERIPSVMHTLASAFNITWVDEGSWANAGKSVEKDIYTRVGKIDALDGEPVVFTAELSTTRSESHFLGIRYHRAILHVEYHLSNNHSSQSTVDILQLDPKLSDSEKAAQANARLHELNEMLAPCTVTMEYHYADPVTTEDDEDPPHLLWLSDRLQIARNIEYRLSRINAELILFEKFMRQRDNVLAYLRREIFGFLDADRRDTITRQALYRWKSVLWQISKGVRPKDVEVEDEDKGLII